VTRIRILDPTAPPPDVEPAPGPGLDRLDWPTARVGIRYDLTWRSFDWVRDEWSTAFREQGASVDYWCAGDRTGSAADATLSELEGFVRSQDVLISGLGN